LRAIKILNITCGDFDNCSERIMNHLETTLRLRLQARNETDKVNGHVSISHIPAAHKVWVFVYDTDGIHESDVRGRVNTRPNARCKRASNFPTRQEVEDHISNAPIPLRLRVRSLLSRNP